VAEKKRGSRDGKFLSHKLEEKEVAA